MPYCTIPPYNTQPSLFPVAFSISSHKLQTCSWTEWTLLQLVGEWVGGCCNASIMFSVGWRGGSHIIWATSNFVGTGTNGNPPVQYHLYYHSSSSSTRLWCLQCPPDHPSRWFVQEVFSRCVRWVGYSTATVSHLSPSRMASYEVFVDFVPDTFFTLLPPAPQPSFAYTEEEDSECVLGHCVSGCCVYSQWRAPHSLR